MKVKPTALPPKEALAYWKDKVAIDRKGFEALDKTARAKAFAVAGLSKVDQIETVQGAIQEALANGETLAQFKGRIGNILERQGWVGKKAWRVETIFRNNVQGAYMAGRYRQMKQASRALPYWAYVTVDDRRRRPSHAVLHGLIYPHDHPFWKQFYPLNGHGCRCTVRAFTKRQVAKRGLKVRTDMPGTMVYKDPKTGMETFVTPLPDRGWSGNVGEDWLSGLTPSELDGKLADIELGPLCKGGGSMFAEGSCKPPLAKLDKRHIHKIGKEDILPKGSKPEEYVGAFLKEFGLANIDDSAVHKLPGNIPVVISKRFFEDRHKGGWKVTKNGRERYLKLLASTIKEPFEIWHVPVSEGKRRRQALRLIRLFQGEDGQLGGFVVFNLVGREWVGTTAFNPKDWDSAKMLKYLEKQRSGVLLYREELK